jgi:hypothetical protein
MPQDSKCALSFRHFSKAAVAGSFGSIAVTPGHVIDLTSHSHAEVLAACWKVVGSGFIVLHGSNSQSPMPVIDPRQANDAAKRSGNHNAVYATIDVEVALMYAIINRAYLRSVFSEFAIGFVTYRGRRVFTATSNVYDLLCERDANVCSDGFVYLLDKSRFTRFPGASIEYQASASQVPICTLKLSGGLSHTMFLTGQGSDKDTLLRHSHFEPSGG